MSLIDRLTEIWHGNSSPCLIRGADEIRLSDLKAVVVSGIVEIAPGDVVALIGDIDPPSVVALLRLIDIGAIIMPLTRANESEHDYCFEVGRVEVILDSRGIRRLSAQRKDPMIDRLREKGHPGLILFSTGSTGPPKAILHDFTVFLERFAEPRPTLRTMAFLLFDHIGGINTLLHALFNRGVVVSPSRRTVADVLRCCREHEVELLPTTPTFLRMMLLSGLIPDQFPPHLRVVTYGTERMDQPTLDELCRLLPDVDFRQTFGMSELGIMRVQSKDRSSLFMRIGGTGIKTRIRDNILHIYSPTRMLGYLNAPSPFDDEGWYDTKDVVETDGEYIRITGRTTDVVNVGGLKFVLSDVESAALEFPGVALARAHARPNPITGHHVELTVQPDPAVAFDQMALLDHLRLKLPTQKVPRRLRVGEVAVGHRFKKL